jgi:hypothetical protein
MAVSKFTNGLLWTFVPVLLALLGARYWNMPRIEPPGEDPDVVEVEFLQRLRTTGDAMAHAYKRSDQEVGERLEREFLQISADYRRYYREKHPLPE